MRILIAEDEKDIALIYEKATSGGIATTMYEFSLPSNHVILE